MTLILVQPPFYGRSGEWWVRPAEADAARLLLPTLLSDTESPITPPGLLARLERCSAVLTTIRQVALHVGPDLAHAQGEVSLWAMLNELLQDLIPLEQAANTISWEVGQIYNHLGVIEAWWELHRPTTIDQLGRAEQAITRLAALLAEAQGWPLP